MLIIIILVVLFIVLTALTIVFGMLYKNKNKFEKTTKRLIVSTVIALVLIVCISIVAGALANDESKYNVLESRYKQLNETYKFYRYVANDEGWLDELYDYNNEVIELKERANNVWTNWFVNRKRISDLKVIEFKSGYPVFDEA